MRGYDKTWREREAGKWGESYESWKSDLRGVDLGLVGDKLERAVREACTKYLMMGPGARRMMLVLPPLFPLPLLATVMDTLFRAFQPPSISLGSAPVLATVAAGLRSALVVDIGWAETSVVAVYEYREVCCRRTVRASKRLVREMLNLLAAEMREYAAQEDRPNTKLVSFEECEEVMVRMAWCKPSTRTEDDSDLAKAVEKLQLDEDKDDIAIKLRSTEPPMTLRMPFAKFSEPAENALFAAGVKPNEWDDEELPLHILIYRTLLQLPVDVRSTVMARLIITGGASSMPGLRTRIMNDVQELIDERGWDPAYGSNEVVKALKAKTKQKQHTEGPVPVSPTESEKGGYHDGPTVAAGLQAQTPDPIELHIRRGKNKGAVPSVHGTLRQVDSMGAWSGGSLVSSLKLGMVSSVEREQWMANGMAGARREKEAPVVDKVKQRQSMGAGLRKGEESTWTLGQWA